MHIGCFEALNLPEGLFFFWPWPDDLEALCVLGEWVANQVLCIERSEGGAWGHGVINTDKYERFYEILNALTHNDFQCLNSQINSPLRLVVVQCTRWISDVCIRTFHVYRYFLSLTVSAIIWVKKADTHTR